MGSSQQDTQPIALLYGSTGGTTREVATRLAACLDPGLVVMHDVADLDPIILTRYHRFLFGMPTYGIGSLQEDWFYFMRSVRQRDVLSGRQVALFGLGDQGEYPDTFAEGLGELAGWTEDHGGTLAGIWPAREYVVDSSPVMRDGLCPGLILDEDQQPHLTDNRIALWLKYLHRDGYF